jgi:chromosome segregation protein
MPTELLIADVRAQVIAGRTVANNLSSKRAAISQEKVTVGRLEKQQANQGAASDPKPFRERLARLMPTLGQLSERDRLDLAIVTEATEVSERGARLTPPVPDLDGLALLPLPTRETISDHDEELKTLEGEYKVLESRLSAAQSTVERLQDELDRQDNAPLEASEENILAVRGSRDSHWHPLRAVLLEETPHLSQADTVVHLVGFEEGLNRADRLSDDAVQNAGALATYAAALNRLNEERITLQRIEDEFGRKKLEFEGFSAKWMVIWSHCGIQPLRPNRMAEWLTEVQNLLVRRAKLIGEKKKLAQIDETVTTVRPSLISLGESLGIAEAEELATGLLVSAVEGEVEIRTKAWNNSADLVTRFNDARDRLGVLEGEEAELLAQKGVWSTNWSALLASMHLPPETTVEGASAAIEVWGKVPGTLKLYQTAKRRVDGMNRDIDAYSDQVFRLIEELGTEGLGTEAEVAIKGLAQRLVSAKKEAAKAEQTAQDITVLEGRVSQAEGEYTSAAGNLEALCARLPDTAARGEQIAALEAREAVLQRLRERRNTVSSLSQGQSEEEMRAALEKFDEESASIEIRNLETQEAALSEDISKAYAQMKKVQDELDQLQKGIGAEDAVQKQKIAEAEMVQNARAWAVKRFAQILLAQVVEQYRSQQEQPLLKRAGEFFSLLTTLRFTGIEHQFDENDTAHLLGRRNTNESIPVDGMSEGTRDQL